MSEQDKIKRIKLKKLQYGDLYKPGRLLFPKGCDGYGFEFRPGWARRI